MPNGPTTVRAIRWQPTHIAGFCAAGTLAIKSDRTVIGCETVEKAIDVWEQIISKAQAQFGDRTTPMHYSLEEYVMKDFKERLITSLACDEELAGALIAYFCTAELIENGCVALSELSLAGRRRSASCCTSPCIAPI